MRRFARSYGALRDECANVPAWLAGWFLRLGEGGLLSSRFHFPRICAPGLHRPATPTNGITRTRPSSARISSKPSGTPRGWRRPSSLPSTTPSSALSCWRGEIDRERARNVQRTNHGLPAHNGGIFADGHPPGIRRRAAHISPLGAAITPIGQRSWRMFAPILAPHLLARIPIKHSGDEGAPRRSAGATACTMPARRAS